MNVHRCRVPDGRQREQYADTLGPGGGEVERTVNGEAIPEPEAPATRRGGKRLLSIIGGTFLVTDP